MLRIVIPGILLCLLCISIWIHKQTVQQPDPQKPDQIAQEIEWVGGIDRSEAKQTCSSPDSISDYFSEKLDSSIYTYQAWLSPCYLEVDFDKDKKKEAIIPIIRKVDKKKGFAIQNPNGEIFLLGAGKEFGTSGQDLKWIDEWAVYAGSHVSKTIYSPNNEMIGTEKVLLEGEALMIGVEEGTTVYLACLGGRFEWIILDG